MSQQDQSRAGSAESRKRRARHEIWDAEADVEALQAKIKQLQEANSSLRLGQLVLQQTISVREQQVERLKFHGQPAPSMPTISTGSSLGRLVTDGPSIKDSWLQQARSHGSTPCTSSAIGSTASSGLFDLLPSCTSSPSRDQTGPSGRASTSPATSECDSPFSELLGLLDPCPPTTLPASSGHLSLQDSGMSSNFLIDLTGPQFGSTAVSGASSWDQEINRATGMNETQLINTFKHMSEQLSSLLFAAEDTHSPQAGMAAAQLVQVVQHVRSTGAIAKVCNPAVMNIVAQPVSSGLEPAGPEHWEAVAQALLLSPHQMQQVAALNEQRAKWLARIDKDHSHVSEALAEVVAQEASQRWAVEWDQGGVRKAELMDKLRRMAGAGRWVMVLVDELLILHILSPIQVARYMVHSYPYVPDACAIVEALHKLHRQQQATAPNLAGAARKPAARGRKRINPVPPKPACT